ncbi:MAG: hypothetical protein GVY32_01405 [Gammaproteobacteria bacterium]|jgi:hypothetical protein|nr:hypothetical protein [Gammaproteobacteria bacterium]
MTDKAYRKVGFRSGMRWLPSAAERLFASFAPLAGVAALWLLVSMIALVPLIGQLAMMLLTPVLTAGVLAAFDEAAAGRRPGPTVLFTAWRQPQLRTRLLGVGAFWIGGSLLALAVASAWLGSQVSPEQLQAAQGSPEAMAELLAQVSFGPLLLVAAGILAAVLSAMYFAVPLLLFESGTTTLAALRISLVAVVANWAAFLGFTLVLLAAAIAAGFVFGILVLFLGLALGSFGQSLGQVLFLLVAMLVQVVMAGTQWFAYRDVFGPGHGAGRDGDDDQLLA